MKKLSRLVLLAILTVTIAAGAANAAVYFHGSDVAGYFPVEANKVYPKSSDVYQITKIGTISVNKNVAISNLAKQISCDIALSTWCLADLDNQDVSKDLADARAKGVVFSEKPFVVDAIPPIIHKDNPLKSITLEELHKIYTGEITNWKSLDKALNHEIEVYITDEKDGKLPVWKKVVLQGKAQGEKVIEISKSNAMKNVASDDHKWSICYDSMFYVLQPDKDRRPTDTKLGEVKVLKVTNPTNMTAGPSKEYPVSRYLYAITRNDTSAAAQSFLDYLLLPSVQKLAYNVNQLPLPQNDSGSSGCNAAFPAAALIALVPMIFFRKKK